MLLYLCIFSAVLFVAFLTYFENKGDSKKAFIFKILSSLMFLVIFFLNSSGSTYSYFILAGMIFAFLGDAAIASGIKNLVKGLTSFLFTHIFYIIAFSLTFKFSNKVMLPAAVLSVVSVVFYLKIKNHLDNMKIPVMVYTFAITLTVITSIFSAFDSSVSFNTSAFVITGAALFLISDMFLAWHLFVGRMKSSVYVFAAYYTGQVLIALSVK